MWLMVTVLDSVENIFNITENHLDRAGLETFPVYCLKIQIFSESCQFFTQHISSLSFHSDSYYLLSSASSWFSYYNNLLIVSLFLIPSPANPAYKPNLIFSSNAFFPTKILSLQLDYSIYTKQKCLVHKYLPSTDFFPSTKTLLHLCSITNISILSRSYALPISTFTQGIFSVWKYL